MRCMSERCFTMKRISHYLILCITILAFLLPACTWFGPTRLVVNPEAVTQVDEILAGMTSSGNFTGSVMIAQDGKVLLSKGYGFADRALEIPNRPETRFHLASI